MKIHPTGLEAVILKKSPNKYKPVFLYISGEIKQKCSALLKRNNALQTLGVLSFSNNALVGILILETSSRKVWSDE